MSKRIPRLRASITASRTPPPAVAMLFGNGRKQWVRISPGRSRARASSSKAADIVERGADFGDTAILEANVRDGIDTLRRIDNPPSSENQIKLCQDNLSGIA